MRRSLRQLTESLPESPSMLFNPLDSLPIANMMLASHLPSNYMYGPGVSGGVNGRARRISRARDKCYKLRTKCDGQNPCAHCVGMELNCCGLLLLYAKFCRVQSEL